MGVLDVLFEIIIKNSLSKNRVHARLVHLILFGINTFLACFIIMGDIAVVQHKHTVCALGFLSNSL